MTKQAPHILIVGSGSVGRRHARNLASLGCTISCMDPQAARRAEMASDVKLAGSYATLDEALAAEKFDGTVIGSPTSFHVAQARAALAAGHAVLLEKPVSTNLADAEALATAAATAAKPLLLGYTWRWWPPLARVRAKLAEGAIGKPLHVQFHMSAHLADWHPWEDYRDFFMSKKELGGGALLDESHWIDVMLWLFGRPRDVVGRVERISDLDIETDDNVDLVFSFTSGLRVTMHLDLIGRPHEKFIRFVGSNGTLLWSAEPNRMSLAHQAAHDWQSESFTSERNDMFMGVAREFLAVLAGGNVETCRIADGVAVLQVIEAARRASAEGRRVEVAA